MDKPTCGKKRTKLRQDKMENRNYVQLKYLVLDRIARNQESRESLSWTFWKRQKTKQRDHQDLLI